MNSIKQLIKYLNTNFLFCRLVNKDGKFLDLEKSIKENSDKIEKAIKATFTKQDPFAKYKFADLDDADATNYCGATDTSGNWYILKEDTIAKTYRYATGNSDYATNWASRASLFYDYLYKVTFF